MHVVAEVDPSFTRTVVVASKFDNRLKEFERADEVDRCPLARVGARDSRVHGLCLLILRLIGPLV